MEKKIIPEEIEEGQRRTEEVAEKEPYPVAVYFILGLIFLARFVLSTPNFYATAVLGAIICDSCIGRYKTVLYFSVFYAIGKILTGLNLIEGEVTVVKVIPIMSVLFEAMLNSIEPCVIAFGGDQYSHRQVTQRSGFFSACFWVMNLSDAISILCLPTLTAGVDSLVLDLSYLRNGAIPGMLMLLATAIFVAGKSVYIMKPIPRNVFPRVRKCTCSECKAKDRGRLDHVEGKCFKKFIEETKSFGGILFIILILPFFWCFLYVSNYRWTFQTFKMNRDMMGIHISPDQMTAVHPLFVLILVPAFDYVVYPLLKKFRLLVTPLQRMTAGGFLSVLAIVVAAFVEMEIGKISTTQLNPGSSQIGKLNHSSCVANFNLTIIHENDKWRLKNVTFSEQGTECCEGTKSKLFEFLKCESTSLIDNETFQLEGVENAKAKSQDEKHELLFVKSYLFDFAWGENITLMEEQINVAFENKFRNKLVSRDITNFFTTTPRTYTTYHKVYLPANASWPESEPIGSARPDCKGSHIASICRNESDREVVAWLESSKTKENEALSVLWQFPQRIVLAASETMIFVSGLHLSYTEAPASLKAVVLSIYLMIAEVGKGPLVLMEIITTTPNDYFLQALWMFLLTLLFMSFACFVYEYTGTTSLSPIESI